MGVNWEQLLAIRTGAKLKSFAWEAFIQDPDLEHQLVTWPVLFVTVGILFSIGHCIIWPFFKDTPFLKREWAHYKRTFHEDLNSNMTEE